MSSTTATVASNNKGSRVKVKKKHVRLATTTTTTTTTTSGVLKRVVRRRSRRDDEQSGDESHSTSESDDGSAASSTTTSGSTAPTTTTPPPAAAPAVAALSSSAGSVLRKSPFRNESVSSSSANSVVGMTRSRSGSRSSPRESFNRPTNVSAKNLLGVEHAGFLRVFNGPPGQRMRFDEKTKSGFLMLRAANLYIYRSRDDDAPSEVIPLRSSAVKVISGGDAMFALPPTTSTATTPPPPATATTIADSSDQDQSVSSAAAAGLQRRDSPPRENAPSILSSLKNRRLRRGSIGSLPQSHVMSSLGHSPGRVMSASASATPDESDDEPGDGASTPTAVGGGSCVFALFTPAASKTFLARDQDDMNEWVAKLNQAATRLLNEALEEVGVATSAVEPDVTRSVRAAGGAVVSERELAKRVAALRALPGNDRCCDCGAADTAWVLANKGGLICIDCSGVHRQMGVTVSKVRSFELDQWSEAALAFLERTGNDALNERLEHRRANADRDRAALTRTDFLRKKYVDQAYVSTSKRAAQAEEFVETFA